MDAYCCVWCGVHGVRLLGWDGESSSVGEGAGGDVSSHALSWKPMDADGKIQFNVVILNLLCAEELTSNSRTRGTCRQPYEVPLS